MEKVEKLKRMEAKRIPENIDYQAINGGYRSKTKLQKSNQKRLPKKPYQQCEPLTLAF